MKVLIIEDEERAARHLERLLLSAGRDISIAACFETVRQSVEYLKTHPAIDLIFSDIQLADGLSFEIFDRISPHCPIIFTTAWDSYTLEAFNTNGIDYLLKPIEEKRLWQAIAKAEQLSVAPLLEKLSSLTILQAKKYKTRFLVKIGERIKPILVSEIQAFYSLEKATYLHTIGNRSYCIDYALDHLEEMLDPAFFFRISRKYIVSAGACINIVSWSNSRLKLKIEGINDQDIVVARERVQDFRAWLDT